MSTSKDTKDNKKDPAPKDQTEPHVRVKVTIHKIYTSQGRGISGQFMELPTSEATTRAHAGEVQICS